MLQLVTEHMDIWTAAQTPKTNVGRGRGKTAGEKSPHGIKKLKELILELAVRGKLMPQNPDDEPASDLLKKIAKEKTHLIKEGKVKKLRSLPEIRDDEKPFELPVGWEWFRTGSIFDFQYGKALPAKIRDSYGDVDVYGSNGVVGKHNEALSVEPCIVIGRKGSAGALNKALRSSWTTDVAYFLVPPIGCDFDYTFLILQSLRLDRLGKGIKPGVNRNEAYLLAAALPPLLEQRRIVAKVDELMALCDKLEQQQTAGNETHQILAETLLATLTTETGQKELTKAWKRIANHFDTLFTTEESIDQLKQTIFQLAVMGKLVPQDPSDEPASVLLKKITKEKERLIKEGKIKKQKRLPEISEDETPFQLPNGWEFVRLGDIANRIGSGSTPRGGKASYVKYGIPFLRSQNVWNHGLELNEVAYISEETHQKMSNTVVFPNDILLNITGASLGRCTVYPDGMGEANVSQHVTIIRSTEPETRFYLHLCILSPYTQNLIWGRQVGMAREGLSKKVLELFEIPIPPLAEQHRIVAKVNELMALCDIFKSQLKETQTTQVQMANTIVERTVN